MLAESYPFYLANKPQRPNTDLAVIDKYRGEVASRVALADEFHLDQAIGAAVGAAKSMRRLAAYEKREVLEHCVRRFQERHDELALALCIEAGKPIRDSRGEVDRLIDTFRIAAEECSRLGGDVLDLEISSRARGYSGLYRRFPIGPCAFISPFNFPLNLVAHKVAPALAVGCPFVLKPASATPVGALLIGEILAETDLPAGAFSILPSTRAAADRLTTDERLKLLSFTGSPAVGWDLKARAGKKKIVLELGGNAACIVDRDADLDDAIERLLVGAFYQSGQSCISVQRIYVHRDIYYDLRDRFAAGAAKLVLGDPKDESTFIGPLISEREATRLVEWVDEARSGGAAVLCGGSAEGAMMPATVLEKVPQGSPLCRAEAFGPVAVLEPFDDFEEALQRANDSSFGLQAGIFTRDIDKIQLAFEELEVGGVVIGDVPSWRVDHMPYGGVKESGLGREGVRFAMEDMSEIRMLVYRNRARQRA